MSVSELTIGQLPTLSRDVADTDLIAIDDGTATYKVAVGDYEATAASAAAGYATAAANSADEAKGYKNTAQQAVSDVGTQVTAAQNYANAASGSATSAYNYADAASGSATTAAGHATSAGTSASEASGYATVATQKASDAADEAARAKSWADYPGGSTSGSATNNAHYWADQAQAAAGGGVMSFNTRNGYVVSQAHDYDASMVDYDNTSSGLTATDVQGAIDENAGDISTINGEITQISSDLVDLSNNKENKATELTATLSAGATSVSFTNAAITSTAKIDVYTDTFGVNPTNQSVSGTTLTLTFKAQAAAVSVKVLVRG